MRRFVKSRALGHDGRDWLRWLAKLSLGPRGDFRGTRGVQFHLGVAYRLRFTSTWRPYWKIVKYE